MGKHYLPELKKKSVTENETRQDGGAFVNIIISLSLP
jgi:hypothetical protein